MRKTVLLVLTSLFLTGGVVSAQTGDYKITPVPFSKVHVDDKFWTKRIQTNKEVTIPIAFGYCESTGRVNNFKIAGGLMRENSSQVPHLMIPTFQKLLRGLPIL